MCACTAPSRSRRVPVHTLSCCKTEKILRHLKKPSVKMSEPWVQKERIMNIRMHQTIVRSVVLGLLVLLTLAFTALPGAAAPRTSAPDFAAIDRYVEQEQQATHL